MALPDFDRKGSLFRHRLQVACDAGSRQSLLGAECGQTISTLRRRARDPAMFNTGYNGLLGLLILIGDVWAIINIFQSSASNEKKLLWTIVVLLLPLLGLILWFFLGPRGGKT
jgi:hypothetical protein